MKFLSGATSLKTISSNKLEIQGETGLTADFVESIYAAPGCRYRCERYELNGARILKTDMAGPGDDGSGNRHLDHR